MNMKKRLKKMVSFFMVITLLCASICTDSVFAYERAEQDMPAQETETSIQNTIIQEAPAADIQEQSDYIINPIYEDVISEHNMAESTPYAADSISELDHDSVVYEWDANAIITTIRNAMEARQENIQIFYVSDALVDNTVINQWIDTAMEETDLPTQGDYLKFVYHSVGMQWSYYSENGKYYTTINIDFTYMTTSEQEKELTKEVTQVMDGFSFTSDTTNIEKIQAIYDYICQNITYDYANLNDEDYLLKYTAYAALIHKTAVCQGYAVLLYRMLKMAGIDARIIAGTGNGENHAWNIVKLNGIYYYLDSTWDAGQSNYRYFLKGSANFTDHESEDRFLTEDFTLLYPISQEDYDLSSVKIYEDDNFKYEISNGIAKVIDYLGSDTDVVVPAMAGNYPVKTIGRRAFQSDHTIETLTFSEGIAILESGSIDYCGNLCELHLPSSIDVYGFAAAGLSGVPKGCKKLSVITVPESNPYLCVKDDVLYNKDMKTLLYYPTGKTDEEFIIPDNIISVGSSSFEDNKYIKKVTMPNTVKSIGYWAFDCASSLQEIHISTACEFIGQYAFHQTAIESLQLPVSLEAILMSGSNMPKLQTIMVDEDNQFYSADDGVLYNKEKTELILCPALKEGSYVIPDSVTWIGEVAFQNTSLVSISIPASVETIEDKAFVCDRWSNRNLKEIQVDNNNQKYCSIDGVLFDKNKTKLIRYPQGKEEQDYYLPEGVLHIETRAFQQCKLKNIFLGNDLIDIAGYAFEACQNLQILVIGNHVSYIGDLVLNATDTLDTIYYLASEEEWNKIVQGKYNQQYYTNLKCGQSFCEEGIHASGRGVVTREATCAENGQKTYTCTVCHEVIRTEVIPTIEHKKAEAVKENWIEPTAEKDGSYDFVVYCSECGQELERTTHRLTDTSAPVIAGIESDAVFCVTDTAPTITVTDDISLKSVKVNGKEIVLTAEHQYTLPKSGKLIITAMDSSGNRCSIVTYVYDGHDNEKTEEKHSVCTSGTVTTYRCRHCGYTHTETTGSGEHKWEKDADGAEKYRVDKKPTCTTEGSKSVHCMVCSEVKNVTVIEAAGHTTDKTVIGGASSHYEVCSICHAKLNEHSHVKGAWKKDEKNSTTTKAVEYLSCTVCKAHIQEREKAGDAGALSKKVEVQPGAPETAIDITLQDLKKACGITDEELKDTISGAVKDMEITLNVTPVDDSEVQTGGEKALAGEKISSLAKEIIDEYAHVAGITYFDISLMKKIIEEGKEEKEEKEENITQIDNKISITVEIPAAIRKLEESIKRKFYILHYHDGETAERIDGIYDEITGKFTFLTDKFSTYAIVYADSDEQILLGDLDGNGDIDASDALIVLKIVASLITPTEKQNQAADVDHDGEITASDALLILKYAADLISEFPVLSVRAQ